MIADTAEEKDLNQNQGESLDEKNSIFSLRCRLNCQLLQYRQN